MLNITKVWRIFLGTLFTLFSMIGQPAARAAEAVAMVTDLTGKGVIMAGGKEMPCEILSYLIPGAEISIDAGAKLTLVYFQSAKEYAFTGEATVRIGNRTPESKAGAGPRIRSLTLVKETGLGSDMVRDYGQAAIVLRGFSRKKKIRLIGPKNTKVLETHPVFRWEPLAAGIQYRFVLLEESGRTLVETLVNDTTFRMPEEIRLRDDEYYSWQVGARLASGTTYSSSADFKLLKKGERDGINKLRPSDNAPFSERVLFAAMLEREGLKDAARLYWQALSAERPLDQRLKAKAK